MLPIWEMSIFILDELLQLGKMIKMKGIIELPLRLISI